MELINSLVGAMGILANLASLLFVYTLVLAIVTLIVGVFFELLFTVGKWIYRNMT